MSSSLKKIGWSLAAVLLSAVPAFAQLNGINGNTPTGLSSRYADFGTTLSTLFGIVIGIGAVAFIILFLVGGIMYLTAAGNDTQTGKARRIILDGVIGLILILIAWAAGNYVLKVLGIKIDVNSGTTTGL